MRRAFALILLALPVLALALSSCGGRARAGIARGADLYDTCRPCHGTSGEGNASLGCPPIAGLPEWYLVAQLDKYRRSWRGAHPEDAEGHRMRPMARSLNLEGDVASVSKYVASLPGRPAVSTLTGGDAAAGEARYTTICATCHGPDASGMEAMGAPPLANQADWYMMRQLVKFKSGMRGAHPEDVQGAQMAAMSATLEDEQAMRDVIAYILTLRK